MNQLGARLGPGAADNAPLLPLADGDLQFEALVAEIKQSAAIDAIARKRATQILVHGHTSENDLERSPAEIAHGAKARLNAFTEIMPIGRMNLPPLTAERCMRYAEIAGAMVLALLERCSQEVPE